MTPLQAYQAELRRQLAALPRIQRSAIERVLAELQTARTAVLADLQRQLSDARRASREKILAEVDRQISAWSRAAAQIGTDAAGVAWTAGIAMVSAPLAAGGLSAVSALRINPRALAAVEQLLTTRIADAGARAIASINSVITQTLIGTTPMSDAITQVGQILNSPRRRAQTIIFTEVGRAHSIASQAAMLEAAQLVPGLRKRWLKSGKRHPRRDHVAAHNQIRLAAEPFLVAGERLMHPRDPAGSAGNTINCGCMSVPVVDGSTFGASRVRIDGDQVVMERRPELTPAEIEHQRSVEEARAAGLQVFSG